MTVLITMEILRVIVLLLLFCFYSIFCFPSRPLNERSTELAWQAWLLVDDQNQNKQYNPESFTRRRITPKSVFIAPTFSPESLPACADGYRPDSMGRCIKIIKLDEEAHLDFLLQKLNAQFGNYDDTDEEFQEDLPTAGPFQLNIPLNGTPDEDSKGDLDVAIVVAPTNGNFALDDSFKANVKRTSATEDELETEIKPSEENLEIENKFSDAQQQEVETTTELTPSTNFDQELSTTLRTTTLELFDETTTFPTETTALNVEEDATIISDQNALFFLKPSLINTTHVENGTNSTEDTPNVTSIDSLTTVSPNPTSTFSEDRFQSESGVRFPSATDDATHRVGYVKFPEKVTQNHLLPHINTYSDQFREENVQQLFDEFLAKNRQSNLESDQKNDHVYNHRNRDKNSNFWSIPQSWSESSPQKPIVLRFSRRSNGRHVLEEHLRPHAQNYQTFYREVPSEDFSYIFGVDPHTRRRNRR